MMSTFKILFSIGLSIMLLASRIHAEPSSSLVDKDAAGAFVQDFYNWYVPMALKQKNSLPWETAIALKPDLFVTKLALALRVDSHTFAKSDGSYTMLETDPFLNTDNPCEHYLVGDVVEYERSYRANLQVICRGKLNSKVLLQAEVIKKKDHWLFANFYYPQGNDLFQLLKELRKKRRNDLE